MQYPQIPNFYLAKHTPFGEFDEPVGPWGYVELKNWIQ